MLGGGPYTCEMCPHCGSNDMWNGECMTCGYILPDEEDDKNED